MRMNIDDSQVNADFTKFRTLDIPGCRNVFELFDRAGVDYASENGAQQITEFAESHPWLDSIDLETAWIINQAREASEKKKDNERA
jgi:hypothetical protein